MNNISVFMCCAVCELICSYFRLSASNISAFRFHTWQMCHIFVTWENLCEIFLRKWQKYDFNMTGIGFDIYF